MKYLDQDRLEGLSAGEFQTQQPYPLGEHPGQLDRAGFRASCGGRCPTCRCSSAKVGVKRGPWPGLPRPLSAALPPGRAALPRRGGSLLPSFTGGLRGVPPPHVGPGPSKRLILTLEWYFAWQGCGVSPHCDARRKTGHAHLLLQYRRGLGPQLGRRHSDARRRRAVPAPLGPRASTTSRSAPRSIRGATAACCSSGPSIPGTASARWSRRPTACANCSSSRSTCRRSRSCTGGSAARTPTVIRWPAARDWGSRWGSRCSCIRHTPCAAANNRHTECAGYIRDSARPAARRTFRCGSVRRPWRPR